MEPLYSVKTALTEEEFVRFNRFVAHSNKKNLTIIIVCDVIILAFAIEHFVTGTNIPAAIGLLAGMLVCVWLFTFGVDRTAKRYYRQYVVKEGSEQTILFFDDHYEQSTSNANANIAYKQLTAIHFTKTNIYLMRSPRVGVVLPLVSCPNGLPEFLQDIKKQNNL
jgi:hypothetical protein